MSELISFWFSGLDLVPTQAGNVNQQHYAASLMKVPVAVAAYRMADADELDLDAPIRIHDEFDSMVAGERFRLSEDYDQDPDTWAALGGELPLREVVGRSLSHSGNLAVDLVLEIVGIDRVKAVLADAHCSVMSQVERGIEDTPARLAGIDNLVTVHDMARIMARIADRTLASAAACEELEEVMRAQVDRDAIPLGLPEDAVIANKTGEIEGVLHDAAIIRHPDREPAVMVILTTGIDDDEATFQISEVARRLWEMG